MRRDGGAGNGVTSGTSGRQMGPEVVSGRDTKCETGLSRPLSTF